MIIPNSRNFHMASTTICFECHKSCLVCILLLSLGQVSCKCDFVWHWLMWCLLQWRCLWDVPEPCQSPWTCGDVWLLELPLGILGWTNNGWLTGHNHSEVTDTHWLIDLFTRLIDWDCTTRKYVTITYQWCVSMTKQARGFDDITNSCVSVLYVPTNLNSNLYTCFLGFSLVMRRCGL